MSIRRCPEGDIQLIHLAPGNAGGTFNKMILSYQHMNSQYKDKTVLRPFYLHDNNIPGQIVLILKHTQSIAFGLLQLQKKYNDVMIVAMVSQISSLTIVYSTAYSDADQRKHQSPTSLAFVMGIHRWPVNSPHKGPVMRKMFPFDDVIMTCNTFVKRDLSITEKFTNGATVTHTLNQLAACSFIGVLS